MGKGGVVGPLADMAETSVRRQRAAERDERQNSPEARGRKREETGRQSERLPHGGGHDEDA
jgi:hypothetical protein